MLYPKDDKNTILVKEYFLKLHPELKLCNNIELKRHVVNRVNLLKMGKVTLFVFKATDKNAPEDPKLNFPYIFSYHALTFNPVTLAISEVKVFGHDDVLFYVNYLDEFYGVTS